MSKYLRLSLGIVIGGLAGFTYYYYWGCKNGCPLQSNWSIMTAYGAFAGFVLTLPGRKKKKEDGNQQEDTDRRPD